MMDYKHIEEMEQLRVSYAQLIQQAEELLDAMDVHAEDYITLRNYYTSEQRAQDLLADEQGLLPPTLKRGVLSEDELYDLMGDYRETAFRMIELGTQMLRNY